MGNGFNVDGDLLAGQQVFYLHLVNGFGMVNRTHTIPFCFFVHHEEFDVIVCQFVDELLVGTEIHCCMGRDDDAADVVMLHAAYQLLFGIVNGHTYKIIGCLLWFGRNEALEDVFGGMLVAYALGNADAQCLCAVNIHAPGIDTHIHHIKKGLDQHPHCPHGQCAETKGKQCDAQSGEYGVLVVDEQ